MITQNELQERLDAAAREYKVPGAAVGIARGDEIAFAVTGVTNRATGLRVVPETLFAAGSVTKVFTAALVMTLVDDGLVDLDMPVRAYLPDFTLADPVRSAEVTVRMLLNHTSGLPGNFTYDLPKGPEVLAQFVELLKDFPFNSPPGQFWSYSNAGLVTAGRIVEVLTGQTWDAALAERVLRPLNLHATTDTDEMILDSTAVGHLVDPATGDVQRAPRFQLGTNGPSGATLWCDIAALVEFGRMHLRDGRAEDGKQVLSPTSVTAMATPQVDVPWGLGVDQWGLGWSIRHTNDHTVLAHTGASAGAHSMLSVVPGQQGVVGVLTNGTSGAMLHALLGAELLQEQFGVEPPVPPAVPSENVDVELDPLVGVYEADEGRIVVTAEGGKLQAAHEVDEAFAATMRLIHTQFPPPPATLVAFAPDGRFVSDIGIPVQFVTAEGASRPEHLYVGRVYRRRD